MYRKLNVWCIIIILTSIWCGCLTTRINLVPNQIFIKGCGNSLNIARILSNISEIFNQKFEYVFKKIYFILLCLLPSLLHINLWVHPKIGKDNGPGIFAAHIANFILYQTLLPHKIITKVKIVKTNKNIVHFVSNNIRERNKIKILYLRFERIKRSHAIASITELQ